MSGRRLLALFGAAAWLWLASAAGADNARDVAVELVLAVDASSSINDSEWRLELDGIAAAFRAREVRDLIAALPHHRIAVSMLIWGAAYQGHDTTGWRLIDGNGAADRLAADVAAYPRRIDGGTAMGEGVAASLRLLSVAPYDAPRRIIDVSGDGSESPPFLGPLVMMPEARNMAKAAGVTINGLAIVNQEPDLLEWYDLNLKTGPGAFVMRAQRMQDFATAFKAKLLRELLPEVSEQARPSKTASLR